ncbi:MAG TPA: aldo/keto reductase, partial [Bacillota bacterium]|nr:aldo/keto reductase [Bacillota bacterium]
FEMGINYIDTAPYYGDGQSEVIVGKALKGWRDRVYLSTKNPIEDASGANFLRRLENSLKKLNQEWIDFYHMWGIDWEAFEQRINQPDGPLAAAQKAKAEGLIKHISFSFHGKPEELLKLIDTGEFESVLCQYNLLDRSNETAIAHAHAKGLGVAVMGPVGGGRLGNPSPVIHNLIPGGVKSSPEIALRFVFANPGVDVALSGMGSIAMVDQNVAIAGADTALTLAEQAQVTAALEQHKQLADLYCTGCGYCMPCPNNVNIPENFTYLNYHRVYALTDYAREQYRILGTSEQPWVSGKKASDCLECGVCETKCPQKIPIMKQLKEVHRVLEG